MEQTRLRELEDQCIQECQPPCVARCPVHVDVRGLTAAIAAEDFQGAVRIFTRTVPFPEIIARTCDQPCQANCCRQTVGGSIEVAALELSCLRQSHFEMSKPTLLPQKDARVAVIGSGLSGLTAAFDLSKKGYQVTLLEVEDRLGGRLWQFPESVLPPEVIRRETEIIRQTGVEVCLNELVDGRFVTEHAFDAWFLDVGEHGLIPFDLTRDEQHRLRIDEYTFQTSQANVFSARNWNSTILSLSEGKRAAISIDRFLQNVSLVASRVNEGAYDTRLVTNITAVDSRPVVPTSSILDETSPEGAIAEAKRCLQCDCMECVKVCEYLKHYGSYPKKYIREIYNNLSIIMRTRTANKMINSCTLCGLCGEVCPTDLDMGAVNREVRQTMVKTSKMPISAHDFALRDMAFSNGNRAALTLGANGGSTCQSLFFPGCQLAASNPEYIPQLYQSLSSVLPEVGVMLRCCGAPADWSGEEESFTQTMKEFERQWLALGKPELLLACSSCLSMFKKHLPDVATRSVWDVLVEHRLYSPRTDLKAPLAIHDPCTSRYEKDWQDAVRTLVGGLGVEIRELEMSRSLTECCGYGGVAWLAHPELVKDIVKRRIGEDDASFLTYCVMCRDLLAAEGKPTLHLLDLLYGQNLPQLAARKGPDYSQRHENRLRARQKMEKIIAGKDQLMPESYEKYTLLLSPEMRALIEDRLILVEDVQKVIEHAETSAERFINQENGHTLAFFKPNLITYWVEYSQEEDRYLIHDAYSHRMELEGGDSHE